MYTKEEKNFFGQTALGARKLSDCSIQKGTILVRQQGRIISTGYNRKIIPSKNWEISAIFDAIFAARDTDISGSSIFSTHFPGIEDIKLIIATGISTLYFFGEINDPEVVNLLNNLDKKVIPLEIVHLS